MFTNWLQNADGSKKDPRMARQHASQFCKMLTEIDIERNLISLLDKHLIRDAFLREALPADYH